MPIETDLTRLLEIRVPLLLAPMAGVSGGLLAAAVSEAGGLGMIGGGYGDRGWLEREMGAAGNARIGIGFISWSLEQKPELLDMALDRAPEAIFLSFGDPANFAGKVARSSSKLIMQVQTLAQARQALDAGADAIVAQGTEAGGHGGQRATFPLVPAIADIAGKVPVLAAGGIADGRGLAAALMLGASGVLCGTAFFASTEALSRPALKAAAIAGSGDATMRSSVFDIARKIDWPETWNLRTLRNPYLDKWQDDPERLRQETDVEAHRYAQAQGEDNTDIAAVIVGEGIDLVTSSRSAREIVADMESDAMALLDAAPRFLSVQAERPGNTQEGSKGAARGR